MITTTQQAEPTTTPRGYTLPLFATDWEPTRFAGVSGPECRTRRASERLAAVKPAAVSDADLAQVRRLLTWRMEEPIAVKMITGSRGYVLGRVVLTDEDGFPVKGWIVRVLRDADATPGGSWIHKPIAFYVYGEAAYL